MTELVEATLDKDKFCIQPHVTNLAPAVFKLLPELCSHSYFVVEVVEGSAAGKQMKLGRHLVREYAADKLRDPRARYQGTLVLRCACGLTDEDFIEPSGEPRRL